MSVLEYRFDVVVVGAGHAGTEAAMAAGQAQKATSEERDQRIAQVDTELGRIGQLRARAIALAPDLGDQAAAA